MCGGRLFQKLAPETGKARLPTVDRLNGGAANWLVEVDYKTLHFLLEKSPKKFSGEGTLLHTFHALPLVTFGHLTPPALFLQLAL